MAKGCESTAAFIKEVMTQCGEEGRKLKSRLLLRWGLGFTAGNLLRQMSSDGLSRNRT